MKQGLFLAFLVVVMLAIPPVAAEITVSQLGGMPIVGPVVSIQVPLSTKSVTVDGKFTTPDEWSDTIGNDLTLKCATANCGNAPVSSLQGKAWLKHDNTWLYYLFQIDYRPPSGAPADWTGSGLEYFWGISGNRYDYHNWYDVCPGLCYGEGFYDGSKHVFDPNSNMFQPAVADGFGTLSGTEGGLYTFELKVLLNPGQALLWNLAPGETYGVPTSDGRMFLYFSALCVPKGSACGTGELGNPRTWDYYRSVTLSLLTAAIPVQTTSTRSVSQTGITSQGETAFSTISSSTVSPTAQIISQMPFGSSLLLLPVAGIIAIVSIFLFVRRRKTTTQAVTVTQPSSKPSTEPSIPTGYAELDNMLAGGLPEGYAVAFVSQSYDERDLLVRKIIQSSLTSERPAFYLSNDIARIRDLTTRFAQGFFALSPVADKIATDRPNLLKIPDVGDLSNLNISSHEIITAKSGTARSKLIIIDLLSDLLLRNKALTTRRWLTDFIGRRKAEGFTVIATLDPSIASKEDVQAIVGVFDGVIEFFEKELQERARRFLVIKKMYGREYSDSELMLDRKALI